MHRIAWWILVWSATVAAQTPPPQRQPLTVATAPKPMTVKWEGADGKSVDLPGQMVFSLSQANSDDTLTGTMIYVLPDATRATLAAQTAQPLQNIPPFLMQTKVAAVWAKETGCPYLRMECGELAFEILSGKIHFKRVTLEFLETQDYLPQLLCHWTRQLNTKKQRRSIITAINRALAGEEPE
jgi:hypothetical protein